jgi:exopolysaccharide biosynthesis polyprenyl glycosylphosphotransferase
VASRVHEGGLATRRWSAAEIGPSLVAAARATDARWAIDAGRAALIWVPAYMLAAGQASSAKDARPIACVATAVWLVCLRSAFAAVHFTLGPAVRSAVGTATGLLAMSALGLWVPSLRLPLSTLLVLTISVFVLSTIWEAVTQRIIAKRRVLVVGTVGTTASVEQAIAREAYTPFAVVGRVDDTKVEDDDSRLGSVSDLSGIVETERPDLIVLADGESSCEALDRLLTAPGGGFKVVGLAHFFEHAFGRVPLKDLSPTWFMSILHLRRPSYTRFAKRTFDVLCASIGLLLTAPLWPLIAGLVRLTPGPIIYRQTRVGEGGKHFTILKFRTMCADAEADRPTYAAERDPRVTRLGRALRMVHLDELPQLWNVLRGDMSVVGPRPERPEFIPMLEEAVPFFSRRLLIKPGVTGWAQLRADYSSDAEGAADKLSYDLWYLRHRNLVVDLAICAKTFSAVLFRPGR